MANTEKADAKPKRPSKYHQYLKVSKRRRERRNANRDPETQPTYGKYQGWET